MSDLGLLEDWLAPRLGVSGLRLTHEGRPGSGFSAETTVLGAAWDGGGATRLVLRSETPDPPVYPTQVPGLTVEVEIQYRVMEAVGAGSGVPVAPLFGYCADPSVVGAPFFVMEFVDGVVPVESPMYTLEGFFTTLAPRQRTAMIENGVRTLAAVHSLDWRGLGLDWLVPAGAAPTLSRQLDIWIAHMESSLAGREHPPWQRALAWLLANQPADTPPVLCWGDPRLGNIIWQDARPACVTDFEAVSIAPAGVDLGWWLMFDQWCHETYGAERLPGELTRDEQRALYESASGRAVGDTSWYEVFAAARYTAIVVRVMNRAVAHGDMPPDQTIWLDNPATTCLVSMMEELGI